jgi:endonuclease/exonuclease/phosphatase family metal-dependent hydrolase
MFTNGFKPTTRAATVALTVGVLASSTLIASGSSAAVQDPMYRQVAPPNVFYPVKGTSEVKDRKNFSSRHRGTDIKAPCGVTAFATHPGTAQVVTNARWTGKYAVRVVSNAGGLVTTSAYLSRPYVTNGQIIQSGQPIGRVSRHTQKSPCGIYFAVRNGTTVSNPSSWLSAHVGKTPPVSRLFGNTGFNVASFNILGASHTPDSLYGAYQGRLDRAMQLWESRKLDVIGTQEFQEATQWARFQAANKSTNRWGTCYWDPGPVGRRNGWDTENAILFRNATMELVECQHFDIPYFNGNTRHVPAALLKQKATGRTAWFLNVHNASDARGDAAVWRARAIRIERAKVSELRAAGRPVFLTGDFNARQEAFCPLTASKLMISPNSLPSVTCAYPRQSSIDWIFAAGQTRFSSFARDTYTQQARISDHPLVVARAHLQN